MRLLLIDSSHANKAERNIRMMNDISMSETVEEITEAKEMKGLEAVEEPANKIWYPENKTITYYNMILTHMLIKFKSHAEVLITLVTLETTFFDDLV